MSSGRQQAISDIKYNKQNQKSPMQRLVDTIINAYVVIGFPWAASDSPLDAKISNIEKFGDGITIEAIGTQIQETVNSDPVLYEYE